MKFADDNFAKPSQIYYRLKALSQIVSFLHRRKVDDDDNSNIIAVREALKLLKDSTTTPEFSIAHIQTPAELNDLWSIDRTAYSQSSIGYELFHGWWGAFPSGLRVLFFGNYIVGAVGIWPLSLKCSDQFKQAKLKEADLSSKMFRSLRNKGTANWYISGIVLRPEFRKTNAIRLLISDGLRTWLNSSLICYPLEMLALAYSQEGQALLERFGFVRFQNASVMPDHLPLYRIAVESQNDLSGILEKRGLSTVSNS